MNRWLLLKRGWNADVCLFVIEMDERLDRKSIIDLLDAARPNGGKKP